MAESLWVLAFGALKICLHLITRKKSTERFLRNFLTTQHCCLFTIKNVYNLFEVSIFVFIHILFVVGMEFVLLNFIKKNCLQQSRLTLTTYLFPVHDISHAPPSTWISTCIQFWVIADWYFVWLVVFCVWCTKLLFPDFSLCNVSQVC